MRNDLPVRLTVGGRDYEIESDFRAVLDILSALGDPELDDRDRGPVVLEIFYPELEDMPPADYEEALRQLKWFINGGEDDEAPPGPKLMDWQQDMKLIYPPVNHFFGRDIRGDEYLHWWTFLSAYMEIGESTFAQVVAIRDKQARSKPLDKFEKEYLRRNKHLVEFKRKYTRAEEATLSKWL